MAALHLHFATSYCMLFNFQTLNEWPKWRKCFEQYRIASRIGPPSEVLKINTLLYCLGEEFDDILASKRGTDDEQKS